MPRTTRVPLRNIPIRIVVDGVEVTGEIETAWVNDIAVVIHTPVSGFGTCLHVPAFAMYPCNWLATAAGTQTVALTPRGQQRAEELLRELYDYACLGKRSGWGMFRVVNAKWIEVAPET